MTFASDILEAVGDQRIIAIALGPKRGSFYFSDEKPDHALGISPVSWDAAKPVLSYEYDCGFGGQDCHDFWAWTDDYVYFVHEYDGSTFIACAPRNPSPFVGATQ